MKVRDRILVVDDEKSIRTLLTTVLSSEGYEVIAAVSVDQAQALISSHCPDVIILDLGLPDGDGLNVLEELRSWSNNQVIVVSGRTMENDKVQALDMGADDYIEKPFGTKELLARVRTAIRHTRTSLDNIDIAQQGKFTAGNMVIDYDKHYVKVCGTDVHLTPREFKIVALLAKHAGKILTYDTIAREIWGPHMKRGNQILRVHMANIRRKIEENPAMPEYIFTEIGVGYRMREPE